MKNNKRIFIMMLAGALMFGFDAQAGLKFGIPDALQKAVGWVQTTAENAMKKVNEVSKNVQSMKVGDKIKGKYEQMKALKGKLEEAVAAGKEKYEAAQNAVASAKSTYESAKGQYDSALGTVQGVLSSPDSTYEEKMDAIESDLAAQAMASLETLEANAYSLSQEMNNRKAVLEDERKAIAKDAENNAMKLQILYEQAETDEEKEAFKQQIEDEKALKEEYQKGITEQDLLADGVYQQLNEEYEATAAQIESAREAAEEAVAASAGISESERKSGLSNTAKTLIGTGVAAAGTGAILAWANRSKGGNSGGEDGYNSTINSSFVSSDQALSDETVKMIASARRAKFKGDIANALVKTMQYRMRAGKVEDDARQTSDNIENGDYKTTAISLDNEMVIQRMKLIEDDLSLEVAKMRLEASGNLIKQGYRLNNPGKNPAQMNLDQYQLTKDDIDKGKRS